MNRLHELFAREGQSPWLDNLKRSWIASGELEQWVERGARGITSNPSIFQKAMTGTDAYDDQLRTLAGSGTSVEEIYWELVVRDILDALEVLRPVHEASEGLDGYVSVEVDPRLAPDTTGTIQAARELHTRINRPNLYVKIPATAEGIPAIRQMISEGRRVNVTLIFSLDRYREVMEAYVSGLEACPGDLSGVSSVASFFISRTDSEVDGRLDALGTPEALALRGRTAVAQDRWPTTCSKGRSAAPDGLPSSIAEPRSSDLSGHPPRPRTRPTPTLCTWTSSSDPTQSTPCPTPPLRHSPTMGQWHGPWTPIRQPHTISSGRWTVPALTWSTSPGFWRRKGWQPSSPRSMICSPT